MNWLKKFFSNFPYIFFIVIALLFVIDKIQYGYEALFGIGVAGLLAFAMWKKNVILSVGLAVLFGFLSLWFFAALMSEYWDVVEAGPEYAHKIPALLGFGLPFTLGGVACSFWMFFQAIICFPKEAEGTEELNSADV